METKLAELVAALPAEADESPPSNAEQAIRELLARLGSEPVPVGRLSRIWTLGTLKAKIAAAYMAHWVRSMGMGVDARQRDLNETHLRAALQLLGGMGYLRGAIMKLGQVLANYPNVVPLEFADVLGRLFFEAPPMHFALLREHVRNELGDEPESLFDEFETEAFAAASFGQVHRARLKGTGRPVAVKVQYPNIARAIRDDYRNLMALVLPMRLSSDWENFKHQAEDVRQMLEFETDYEHEAENMRIARLTFREGDEIVVPRSYPELSTKRVLTMDLIEGKHLNDFLATQPSQERRDRHGHQIALSSFRLSYGAHLMYADPQPGNYIFMPDGRLGLIDFGCCHHYTDEDVAYMTDAEIAAKTSEEAERRVMFRAASMTPDQSMEEDRMRLMLDWAHWCWEPLRCEGPFDFGDAEYFRRGMEAYKEMVRRRYVRSRPVNTWLARNFAGIRAMLYHLGARVDMHAISEQETTVRVE